MRKSSLALVSGILAPMLNCVVLAWLSCRRGVMACPPEKLTKDGYDLHFGVNVLGHFHFTTLLLPTILDTPEPRIINVTSIGHQLSPFGGLYWDYLKGPKKGTRIPILEIVERYRYYGSSKLVRGFSSWFDFVFLSSSWLSTGKHSFYEWACAEIWGSRARGYFCSSRPHRDWTDERALMAHSNHNGNVNSSYIHNFFVILYYYIAIRD